MGAAGVIVVMALVFAALVLGFQGIFLWVAWKREEQDSKIRRRLGVELMDAGAANPEEEAVAQIIREQAVDAAAAALGEYGERIETLIRAANAEMTVTKFIVQASLMGLVIGFGLTFVVGPAGLLAVPLGAYVPFLLLQRQADARATSLLTQMPDALENMSRAMQTGTGLSEAFRIASEEMPEPISVEFGRIYEEVRFGKDWREVLNGLVERNPTIFDLRLFVSTLLLQRDTGGNMIETLASIAKTIRNRYVFDAKVKAMTSEARASGFVLGGMPVAVVALILVSSPDYLEPLWTSTLGNMFIMLALVWYLIGIYMMRLLSQVEA
jgi:tight adherence protein B